MGVYVKGMGMPGRCVLCDFIEFSPSKEFALCKRLAIVMGTDQALHGRLEWCPLVNVPEPHGRLIDADAFFKDICDSLNQMTDIGITVDESWLWAKLNDAMEQEGE